jgi:protein required for attachment to host cells
MTRDCVIVADGCRARFFTLEPTEFPEIESGPNLIEVHDLIQPEKEMHPRDLWSDSKNGGNRGAGGGSHGYDDHREQHAEEYERRFARSVAEEALRLARRKDAKNIVLVAQKRMLGLLRNTLHPMLNSDVQVRELAKDLSKLGAHELHEHLAREELIPRRRSPAA